MDITRAPRCMASIAAHRLSHGVMTLPSSREAVTVQGFIGSYTAERIQVPLLPPMPVGSTARGVFS